MSNRSRFTVNRGAVDEMKQLTLDYIENEFAPQVASDAKRNAPVDTGELRDSIRVERDGEEIIVAARSGHAIYLEEGTSNQRAQPFLRPALYQRRSG